MTTAIDAEPSREQAGAIAANVRLLTGALTDLSGESLPPSRAGVACLMASSRAVDSALSFLEDTGLLAAEQRRAAPA